MKFSENFTISMDLVKSYSELTGDKNPIHLDYEHAKQTIFKKPIAHGMLISSFFSKIISETYPGHGSIYLSQSLNFKNPCYVGDKIEVVIELLNKNNNKYELLTQIYNSDKTLLVDGNALILKK